MKPLSLHDQALLYIVCNLEHLKVEALKVLPEKFRHEILINLPAIDICALEEAGVAADSNSVWDHLCRTRIPQQRGYDVERNIMYNIYSEDWRAYYFSIIIHLILDNVKPDNYRNKYELVLHMLLGVMDCANITNWSSYRFTYFAPIVNDRPLIPNRHLRHLATRRSDIRFLSFMMEICSYRPRFLYIVCDLFGESEVYKKHASDLLNKLLCKVEMIVFTFDYDEQLDIFKCYRNGKDKNLPYDAPNLILKAALSHDPPALKVLEFREFDAEMLGEALKIAGPLFYASLGKASKHIPYRGLREILLSLHGGQCPTNELLQKLATIIKNQASLEKLLMYRFVVDKAHLGEMYLKFLSSLSPFIKKSNFRSLGLRKLTVPVEGAQNIIDAFLASPCLHRQTLTFESVSIVGKPSDDDPPRKIPMHDDSVEFKNVEFYSTEFPTNFFKWVLGHPHIWLYRFQMANCKFQEPPRSTYHGRVENVLHLCAEHNDFKVHHLDLCNIKPPHCRTSRKDFEVLLSNPNLGGISFRGCSFGHHGLLPDLTAGLRKQLKVGNLLSFSLVDNEFGLVPLEELQEFFDVLFAMPQIERGDLNLSHSEFDVEHFRMMYDTWKRQSKGKPFKMMSCLGQGFPKHDKELSSKIEEIAVECYHW